MESKKPTQETLIDLLEGLGEDVHPEQLFEALNLLDKICTNIGNNPLEPKFRQIKATNKVLQAKLFAVDAKIRDVLTLLGFQADIVNDIYELPESNIGLVLGNVSSIRDYRDLAKIQLNGSEQDIEKQQLIMKEKREQQKVLQEQQREQQKLKDLCEADKKERHYFEKGRSSKANKLQFGSNIKTAKDCGINVNAGGRRG